MATEHRYTLIVTSLWQSLVSTTERATRMGALVSVPTRSEIVEECGIPFVVHISALQNHKTSGSGPAESDHAFNPFLPPDPDLFVSELPPRHIGVLNKFNVIRHHLLIVTRTFEAQDLLLTPGDFVAMLTCMTEIDGLGFYNGGTVAGASQTHKHLQLVPLPLGSGPRPTPLDSVVDGPLPVGEPTRIPAFDFRHAVIPLDGSRLGPQDSAELHGLYRRACAAVEVHDETQPYNMLVTRRWMLLVPRSREHWHGVSLNALAFAGSLLVRNRTELERIEMVGPLAVLKSVVDENRP